MRISDWSSDVCSSDLRSGIRARGAGKCRRDGDNRPADETGGVRPAAQGTEIGRIGRHRRRELDGADDHHPLSGQYSGVAGRSEEHTSELQSLMRISYAVFCLKKKKQTNKTYEILPLM